MSGKVYLIGAGPGDVELLTMKAIRALRQSDVALVDDLVNPEVLQFLRRDARVIEVGKRGGCRSTPQRFIERQMVHFARQGLCVARVKGGDPFVFGRGGEEMTALRAAGIDLEVVNGITAGIGVPAALGIPVTHRGCSRGVTFVTGHAQGDEPIHWDALVQSGVTLVIYMGMSRLAEIVAALQSAGMDATTPVAVVQHGTLPNQVSLVACLGDVTAAVQRKGLGSPALVVVGEVVRFAAACATGQPERQVA